MLKKVMLIGLMLFASAAQAGRMFPASAQVGQINGFNYPEVKIGSEVYRMGPGVRIYDTNNRIIMPTTLPQSAKIYYQLDPTGFVYKIWLPTPEEEAGMAR